MANNEVIVVSSDSEDEVPLKTPKRNYSQMKGSVIEIDLTGESSPPNVVKKRGTPYSRSFSESKNRLFGQKHAYIDDYFPPKTNLQKESKKQRRDSLQSLRTSPTSIAPVRIVSPSPSPPIIAISSTNTNTITPKTATATPSPPILLPPPHIAPAVTPTPHHVAPAPNPPVLTPFVCTPAPTPTPIPTPSPLSTPPPALLQELATPITKSLRTSSRKLNYAELATSGRSVSPIHSARAEQRSLSPPPTKTTRQRKKTVRSVIESEVKQPKKRVSKKDTQFSVLETTSNSNHSTCSLGSLPPTTSTATRASLSPPPLAVSLFSHIEKIAKESHPTTKKPITLDLFLQSIPSSTSEEEEFKSQSRNVSSTAVGFRLFEKSIQNMKAIESPPNISLDNSTTQSLHKTNVVELPLPYCSTLFHCFNLGDCSRLIGECQLLVLSRSSIPHQFFETLFLKIWERVDEIDSWFISRQEVLNCFVDYLNSTPGKSLLTLWKPTPAFLNQYTTQFLSLSSKKNFSLNLLRIQYRWLELAFNKFKDTSIANYNDLNFQTGLGKIFQQILSTIASTTISNGAFKHNQPHFNCLLDLLHLCCQIYVEHVSNQLQEHSVLSSAPNSTIYQLGKNVVKEIIPTSNLSDEDYECIFTYCNNRAFCKLINVSSFSFQSSPPLKSAIKKKR